MGKRRESASRYEVSKPVASAIIIGAPHLLQRLRAIHLRLARWPIFFFSFTYGRTFFFRVYSRVGSIVFA